MFETAWTAAAENYPFFELKGIDWAEVRERHAKAVARAETDEEFYFAVQRMIAELQDGHSRFTYIGEPWDPSVPSLEFVAIEGRYYVARVLEGSDAWNAGIRAGTELLAVDGEAVSDRFDRLQARLGGANEQWRQRAFVSLYLTAGESLDAQLELAAPGEAAQVYTITRIPEGDRSEPVVEGRLLESGYGYIRIRSFPDDKAVVDRYDALLDELVHAKGLILDIRGNGGGSTNSMYDMAGRLFSEKLELFRWHKRRTRITGFKPRGKSIYVGPVILLIDDAVFSTSNALAEGLSFSGRATLLGRTTAGGTGIPEFDELLTAESRLQLSNHYHDLIDGTQTEVTGVVPDIEIPWTPELLAAGAAQSPGDPAGDVDLTEAIAVLDTLHHEGDTSVRGDGCSVSGQPRNTLLWGSVIIISFGVRSRRQRIRDRRKH